ncbi:MAG: benzoate-CoA ligase family protein [Planctomycetes bacterium]|nr:benzoate-CoA ligase family protein [Planctomycetota bacterium]
MSTPVFPDSFNMADYFVFSNIEAGRGDKVAIIFEDRRITYREVADNVMKVARRLVDEYLQPEQRVLVCMQDRPEFAYAWFGAIKAGATVTQINPLLPVEDYEYYLNYVKPQFAFVDEASLVNFDAALRKTRYCNANEFRDNVIVAGRQRLETPRKVYFERDSVPPAESYEPDTHQSFDFWKDLPCEKTSQPWPTRKDDPAVWLFTSGSTGQSKGAVHMHHHFAFNTEVYAKQFIGMRESDITIAGPRLFFGYATGTNLMFPFAVGATTVLFKEHPTPELLAGLIEKHKCTVFTSVPTLINKFLQTPAIKREALKTVRFMWSAGEALPADLHKRWDESFGTPIIDGIGSAESFHIYISNRPAGDHGPADIRPGSLGKLVPGYTAKLLDDNDQPVAHGDVGTLWVKGESVATHYHSAYDKSREHLRGGWVVSGDKFRQDADGYWFYEGRGDDLLKVGGIFVSPLEVENCLMQHPAVKECCVIGKNDEAGLTKPLAIVVSARSGSDGVAGANAALEQELIAHCKAHMVRYKAPHWIQFVDKPLPRNDRDKIDRKALRTIYRV